MKQPINITAATTLEINGIEYSANVSATVYPIYTATYDDDGGEQDIEIDDVAFNGIIQFYPKNYLSADNYNRCLSAIQQKIESL